MAYVETLDGRDVEIGRILSRAFGTMGSNPVTVFGISLLLSGLPGIGIAWFQQVLQRGSTETLDAQLWGKAALFLLSLLGSMVLSGLTQGALVKAALSHSEGRTASLGDSIGAGMRFALPLIGLSILFALGVGAGFMLFMGPGIMLFVAWSVSAPALVAERTGVFGAFTRSRDLTRGVRWKVFGLFVILLVITWIVASVSGVLTFTALSTGGVAGAGGATATLPAWLLVLNGITQTITSAITATMQTSLYVELRNAKDGPPTAALAEIFA